MKRIETLGLDLLKSYNLEYIEVSVFAVLRGHTLRQRKHSNIIGPGGLHVRLNKSALRNTE